MAAKKIKAHKGLVLVFSRTFVKIVSVLFIFSLLKTANLFFQDFF